ncbi:CU044_5270 family protein [Streptomyces sp. MA15]|uniref:CU044_5270 family protein n=1 Tax=Streptomyces sp. MA15 TaxID=3055061 RepID=UPI0025B08C02|nr:CU044_5270 family protein [Streptomyces sp. MA15]MDN3270357.1 CU044_5270 family protein [Streptomyces sp. MA15]
MNTEEREELLGLLPPAPVPALSPVRATQMEAHLMREIAPEGSSGQARPAAKRPRRRVFALAVPVGVAAAVCATVLSLGSGGTERPSTDPEAVELLNRIAAVAAAQDAPEVRDGQYVYTLTQGTREVMDEGTDTVRRADWHPVDGKGDGLARVTVLDGPSGKGTTDMTLSQDPNLMTYRELRELPTDTDELYERVWAATEGQGPTHEEAALEMIGSMLHGATLLPEVDAALYRAAARIPGVTVVEDAEDAAGRTGVGLAFADGDDRDVWVFGKKDLNYLGSDEVALLDVDVVDEAGETPAG